MIKLALLGTLSTHTEKLCKCVSNREDIQIVGIFGEDTARTDYLCRTYCLEQKPVEELVEQCNVAAILFRDGGKHLKYAEPFVKKGIPLFVDKPFTVTVEDAQALIDLCKTYDCPFIGGSCVKLSEELLELKEQVSREPAILSGYCSFMINLDSPYGGMHFYSHHLIEAMLQLFGTGVRSVTAKRTGKTLTAIAAYDLFPVFMNYSIRHDQLYAGYYGANGNALVPFSWSKAGDVQFEELVQFAKTKEMKYRPEYFLEVVKISCALEQSMKEERTVYLF